MKKVSLWIIILSFPVFIISCSTDEFTEHYDETTTILNKAVLKQRLIIPHNSTNEYDSIGMLQNHILDIYLSENHNHNTIEEINDEIQRLIYDDFGNVRLWRSNPIPSPVGQIIDIINSPESSLTRIISDSHLTSEAKISLTNFISSLLDDLQGEEYEDIYEFIVLYESSIIENTLLNNEDKRVILTVTAMSRYSFSYGKDRKDKDWETSVGNIAAAVGGALDDPLVAINMTLVTGISLSTLYTN